MSYATPVVKTHRSQRARDFWDRYHNHIYFLIATALALYMYFWPLQTASAPTPKLTPKRVVSEMLNVAEAKRQEHFDRNFAGRRIRLSGEMTGGLSAAAVNEHGIQTMSGLIHIFTDKDGVEVWVGFDEKDRSAMEMVTADTLGANVIEGVVEAIQYEDGTVITEEGTEPALTPGIKSENPKLFLRQGSYPQMSVRPGDDGEAAR